MRTGTACSTALQAFGWRTWTAGLTKRARSALVLRPGGAGRLIHTLCKGCAGPLPSPPQDGGVASRGCRCRLARDPSHRWRRPSEARGPFKAAAGFLIVSALHDIGLAYRFFRARESGPTATTPVSPLAAKQNGRHWSTRPRRATATSRWYHRYVVVRGQFLLYYKTRDAQKVAGWVRLSQVSKVEPMEPEYVAPGALLPRSHVFRVVIVQRTLYFCGESAADVSPCCKSERCRNLAQAPHAAAGEQTTGGLCREFRRLKTGAQPYGRASRARWAPRRRRLHLRRRLGSRNADLKLCQQLPQPRHEASRHAASQAPRRLSALVAWINAHVTAGQRWPDGQSRSLRRCPYLQRPPRRRHRRLTEGAVPPPKCLHCNQCPTASFPHSGTGLATLAP